MSRLRSLHEPGPSEPSIRANVRMTGALAVEMKALADEYQVEPAALIRELAIDGLRMRKRLHEVS